MFNPTLAGQHNSTAPTLTDGAYAPVELDVNGNQKVAVQGTVAVSVSNLPSTQPVSGSVSVSNLPATQAVSIAALPALAAGTEVIGHVIVDSGTVAVNNFPATQPVSGSVSVSNLPATQPVSGTVAVSNFPATQPVSLATAPTTTVVQPTGTNLHVVVDSAPTTPVTGTVGISGTVPVSLASAVTVNNPTAANLKVDPSGVTSPVSIAATVATKLTPQTSGGCSTFSGSIGATATAIKTTPGQLYGCVIGNSNTSAVYVQLFDATSATLGTTAPKLSLLIPAGGGLTRDFVLGVQFSVGIMFACTTTRTGATSPTNTVDVNFDFI